METWETVTMSRKEVPRAGLLKAALAGKITNAQGALAMQLSVRQFQRVKGRFAAEEVDGLPLSRSSVRRLRRTLGLPATRRRRGRQVRTRRPPEAQMGALVQLDASLFAWLEDRGPVLALHGAIDDATGTGLALVFRPTEDLHGYGTLLHTICTTYGLPLALYGDR